MPLNVLQFAAPVVLALVGSWLLAGPSARLGWWVGAIDYPGERKIHRAPIPRTGGLAVLGATLAVWAVLPAFSSPSGRSIGGELPVGMVLGLIPVMVVSFLDDVRSVRAAWKLTVQLLGASIAVSMGVRLGPEIHLFGHTIAVGVLAWPISVLWIVGVTNALNLADGLDGLSAGLALVSSASLAALGIVTLGPKAAMPAAVLVGALLGFVPYNIYPARIFLGDTGSASIGFCLACLGLRSGATLSSGMAIMIPVIVTGVPIAEAAVSVARRVARRMQMQGQGGIFDADRDHIHHRLLAMGLTHRNAVLLLYGISVSFAGVGLASLFLTARNAALVFATLIIAAFIGVSRLGYDEFAVIRRGMLLRVYDAPVLKVNFFPVFFDIGLVILSLYGAIALKYDDWSLTAQRSVALDLLGVLPLVVVGVFKLSNLYRDSWRHASVEDLARASAAVVTATLASLLVCRVVLPQPVSATLILVFGVLLLVLLNGARSSFRLLSYLHQRRKTEGEPVIIYGAGQTGAMALREIFSNTALRLHPIGFIDDDVAKTGRLLNGYPVLGGLSAMRTLLATTHAKGLILASGKLPGTAIAEARQICVESGVWLMNFQIGLTPSTDAAEPDDLFHGDRPEVLSSSRLRQIV